MTRRKRAGHTVKCLSTLEAGSRGPSDRRNPIVQEPVVNEPRWPTEHGRSAGETACSWNRNTGFSSGPRKDTFCDGRHITGISPMLSQQRELLAVSNHDGGGTVGCSNFRRLPESVNRVQITAPQRQNDRMAIFSARCHAQYHFPL